MNYIRAALRMSIFIIGCFFLYSAWFIGHLIVPNKQYWRQIAFRIWARGFVVLSGLTVEVLGEKPKAPFFLVSNHLGYIDIPVLRSVVDSVFVAKGDIRSWIIAGKVVSDMGMIFIDRGNRRDIPRAGSEIMSKLKDGEGVIIFPEGTSTKGEEVLPFNSSFFEFAARSDLPIHYASISYRIENGRASAGERICWWDDTSFVVHLWRFFQIRRSHAIISFGCESVVKSDRKELARELWKRVNDHFVPVH